MPSELNAKATQLLHELESCSYEKLSLHAKPNWHQIDSIDLRLMSHYRYSPDVGGLRR